MLEAGETRSMAEEQNKDYSTPRKPENFADDLIRPVPSTCSASPSGTMTPRATDAPGPRPDGRRGASMSNSLGCTPITVHPTMASEIEPAEMTLPQPRPIP